MGGDSNQNLPNTSTLVQSPDNIDDNDLSSRKERDKRKEFDINDIMSENKQNSATALVLYDHSPAPPEFATDEQDDVSISSGASVRRNTATDSASQSNNASGPGSKVAEKQAHGKGAKQENKEQSAITHPQNEQLARAVIQGNISSSAARQRNRVIGSDTLVRENEAHGEGTSQENIATTCVLF